MGVERARVAAAQEALDRAAEVSMEIMGQAAAAAVISAAAAAVMLIIVVEPVEQAQAVAEAVLRIQGCAAMLSINRVRMIVMGK